MKIIIPLQGSLKIKKIMKKLLLLFVASLFYSSLSFTQNATINITNVNTTVMNKTNLLFGITFDSRTSLSGNSGVGQIGYYNANGTVIPAVDAVFNNFPMSTLRYPGNGIAVGFDWKKSIGPVNLRPNQNILGNLGPAQPVNFGFDEFMAMTAAKGVPASEIQIMVPIYDSATAGLTPTQQMAAIPNVIANNVDWVEYCNAPNNGSNPGGGVDYAAQRAANGHPQPYGIKIWNIGNEPWSGFEYGPSAGNCNSYLNDVTPIINAMLAIDPTIKITMPTTGNATNSSNWSYALINSSLVSQGKVYALSQHYFPSEKITGSNPPAQGVNAVNTGLNSLIAVAANKGVKVFVGDYAHHIHPTNPSQAQKDSAMQWLAANMETDFLLMLSQKSTIERANFWVYGNAQAVWHPIRYNSAGNYTLMPAAEIYKLLFPAFLDQSVAVTTSSPAASDLNPYAVRSNAFVSNDKSKLNIIAVNRDKNNTVDLQVSGTAGYFLNNTRILTATSNTAESIITNSITANGSGNYSMPPMSVLILEYSTSPTGINNFNSANDIALSPNPNNGQFTIELPGNYVGNTTLEIYNAFGQIVFSSIESKKNLNVNIESFCDGVYFVKTTNNSNISVSRFIKK